jgi:DHA2 family multidrug resistance protein-like MFS transporter
MVAQSLAGATAVAQGIGGDSGAALLAAARQAFVDGMGATAVVGTAFAIGGAVIALAFLPDRVSSPDTADVRGRDVQAGPVGEPAVG